MITKYKQADPEPVHENNNEDGGSTADIDDIDDESEYVNINDNNCDSDDSDFEEEGATTMDNEEITVTVPDKYKCALTEELMINPVICGHNNKTFEKTAIYEYIQKNGHLPDSDDNLMNEASLNQINVKDISSYLLFDDLSLKIEIEQFKELHDL